eukprot:TRINITY_DN24571_c0_g2_i1.p1 TRINITY_DN24571_c0_g2~~TRINITY_DN24571_c0_g2_i1.p1  ORF type:complete len:400 (+),score=40.08 TRINITY_DN24571_c0_g2_i1:162-1361(+)
MNFTAFRASFTGLGPIHLLLDRISRAIEPGLKKAVSTALSTILATAFTGPNNLLAQLSPKNSFTVLGTTFTLDTSFLGARSFLPSSPDAPSKEKLGLSYRFSVNLDRAGGDGECPHPFSPLGMPYFSTVPPERDLSVNMATRVLNCAFDVAYHTGLLRAPLEQKKDEPLLSGSFCLLLPDLCAYHGNHAVMTGHWLAKSAPLFTSIAPTSHAKHGILGASGHVLIKFYVEGCGTGTGQSCFLGGCPARTGATRCSWSWCECQDGHCSNADGTCVPADEAPKRQYAFSADAFVSADFEVALTQPAGNDTVMELQLSMKVCTAHVRFVDPGIGSFSFLAKGFAEAGIVSSMVCEATREQMELEKATKGGIIIPFPEGMHFNLDDSEVTFMDGYTSLGVNVV